MKYEWNGVSRTIGLIYWFLLKWPGFCFHSDIAGPPLLLFWKSTCIWCINLRNNARFGFCNTPLSLFPFLRQIQPIRAFVRASAFILNHAFLKQALNDWQNSRPRTEIERLYITHAILKSCDLLIFVFISLF